MIRVVNIRDWFSVDMVYVGRKSRKFKGSVLRNDYRIGRDGNREEVIKKYKKWVWKKYNEGGKVRREIDRLVEKVINGEDVVLGCWCKPKKCHGDVLRDLIDFLVSKGDIV